MRRRCCRFNVYSLDRNDSTVFDTSSSGCMYLWEKEEETHVRGPVATHQVTISSYLFYFTTGAKRTLSLLEMLQILPDSIFQ